MNKVQQAIQDMKDDGFDIAQIKDALCDSAALIAYGIDDADITDLEDARDLL